jgi:hypothetical protein
MVKFVEKIGQNSLLPYFPYNPKAKLRTEVLFKKFHRRINWTTLYSTKLHLLNTINRPWKSFLGKISKILQRRYPLKPEFQNSKYFVLFLDPMLLNKSAVRFILEWISFYKIFIFPFWVGMCMMRGNLRTQSFGISSAKSSFKYILSKNKSAFSFVLWRNSLNKTEQNSDFALFPTK